MNSDNFPTQTGGNLQTGNPQQIAGSGLQQPESNLQGVGSSMQLLGNQPGSQLSVTSSTPNAVLASSTSVTTQPPPTSDNRNMLPFVSLALVALIMSGLMLLMMFRQSSYKPK